MYAAINQQTALSTEERQSQMSLVDMVALLTLLVGLLPPLAGIVRASRTNSLAEAANITKSE